MKNIVITGLMGLALISGCHPDHWGIRKGSCFSSNGYNQTAGFVVTQSDSYFYSISSVTNSHADFNITLRIRRGSDEDIILKSRRLPQWRCNTIAY